MTEKNLYVLSVFGVLNKQLLHPKKENSGCHPIAEAGIRTHQIIHLTAIGFKMPFYKLTDIKK